MTKHSSANEKGKTQNHTSVANVVSVAAPAKINLHFDILSKRADGYHEILTLFQALDLYDILTFQFCAKDDPEPINYSAHKTTTILLKGESAFEPSLFPLDNSNTISRAINIFLSALPQKYNIRINVDVEKNIPIGAGLAGGSSDAAATLIALNHYFNNPFEIETLLNFASQIGSDVSFCLSGGLSLGRGRGEQLERLNEKTKYHFVLVKPKSLSISTPWAYRMYDQFIESEGVDGLKPHSISKLLLALKFESGIEEQAKLFWNAFEPAIFKEYPILEEIKKSLLKLGCISAHLTGSGPTIFGLVKNKEEGQRILSEIQGVSLEGTTEYKTRGLPELDTWLTKSIDTGVHILLNKGTQGEYDAD